MLFGDVLIEIGNNVDAGNGKVIYTSKNGAVIVAASVVKGEIPDNAVAVGATAKVKKYRE